MSYLLSKRTCLMVLLSIAVVVIFAIIGKKMFRQLRLSAHFICPGFSNKE